MKSLSHLSRARLTVAFSAAIVELVIGCWLALVYGPSVKAAGQEPAGAYFTSVALIGLAVWLAKESFWATRTDVFSSHICQRRSSTTLTLAWKDVSAVEVLGYRVLLRAPSGALSVPCWLYTNPGELRESILKAVAAARPSPSWTVTGARSK